MSAYREQKTNITDTECLMEALKELGCKPVLSETPINLEGYQGDKRKQTADIVLPRKTVGSASNDIGFKKNENGTYDAIISDYDSSRYNKAWLDKLTQAYANLKVKKTAKKLGLKLEETKTDSKGNKVLRYTVNS